MSLLHIDAWANAGVDPRIDYVVIPASSSAVRQAAESLVPNQYYSVLGPDGANSNSAARAVADRAAGQPVPLPGRRLKPAESSYDEIRFEE